MLTSRVGYKDRRLTSSEITRVMVSAEAEGCIPPKPLKPIAVVQLNVYRQDFLLNPKAPFQLGPLRPKADKQQEP